MVSGMDPYDGTQLHRFKKAVDYSVRQLEPFRRHQRNALRQYVGAHYSDDGAPRATPVPLMELAVGIYLRRLVSAAPRANITTHHRTLRPTARLLTLALNRLILDIQLEQELQEATLAALLSPQGVVKIGMNPSRRVEWGGTYHDVGQPFCQAVSLDNWIQDMSVTRWQDMCFMGNRYRVPLEDVQNSGMFDPDVVAELQSHMRRSTNATGDERTENLSLGTPNEDAEYKDMVDLGDFYLPKENKIMTLAMGEDGTFEGAGHRPLRYDDWDGPEKGPYRRVFFNRVLNNNMPLSPASILSDMHELANEVMRKLGRQASRAKTILGYRAPAESDARRVVQHNDGDTVLMDDPAGMKEVNFAGPNNVLLAFFLQTKDLFSYHAGNIDLLGGLSPQSETLGQDQMLGEAASERLNAMQQEMVNFTRDVIRDLGWHLFYDPFIELPLTKRVPGTDIEIPVVWNAEQREGDFLDYNFDIEPYSMQYRSPSQKFAALKQYLSEVLGPLLPQMEQQGVSFNIEQLNQLAAQYNNLPEIEEILTYLNAPQIPKQGPVGEAPRKAPFSRRVYERVNRPGASRTGKDQVMAQALMGVGQQQSQTAALGRPTG